MRPMKTATQVMAKKAGITSITATVRSTMGHGVRRGRVTGAGAERGAADITIRAQWTREWEVGRENIVTITLIGIAERAMEWSAQGRVNGGPGRMMAHVRKQGRGRGAPGAKMEVTEGGDGTDHVPVKLSRHWKERSNEGMESRRRASHTATGKTIFEKVSFFKMIH